MKKTKEAGAKRSKIGIRIKLLGIIIPIVLVLIVAFFALSTNLVLKSAKENMQIESQKYSAQISAWTSQIFGGLEIYQNAIESGIFANDEEILQYMETSVDADEAYPVGLYMGDDKGTYLDASLWVPGDDWVLVERSWYLEGKEHDTFAFGEPYYDSQTGQMCVSATVRVDYPSAVRVLAVDVYMDYIVDLIANIAEESVLKPFLVETDGGMILAHPDKEMLSVMLDAEGIDSLYNNIAVNINENKTEGVMTIHGSDEQYMVCMNPIEGTSWYLVTYVTEDIVLAELYQMEGIMAVVAVVVTLLLVFAIFGVMNGVVKPVSKVTNIIGKIAEGDFTQKLEVKGSDEIAKMGADMQMFIEQMRSTIGEITHTAEWLGKQSEKNKELSDSLNNASGSQTKSVAVVSDMVGRLTAAAQEVSAQMEELAQLIGAAAEEGTLAGKLMWESVTMSQKGKQDMEQVSTGMRNINASIQNLSAQVDEVGKKTEQIGEMVNIIVDISEETNLLSLNASIEAARAGEAGRGFAVVAEQIGKLAANSSVAADDISELTADIRSTVEHAVHQMEESVNEVARNVGNVTNAGEAFESLYGKVEETSKRVEQMVAVIEKVDAVSKELETITEQQVEATEQIAQSTLELEMHTEKVSEDSNVIAEEAKQLQQESFKLTDRMKMFRI